MKALRPEDVSRRALLVHGAKLAGSLALVSAVPVAAAGMGSEERSASARRQAQLFSLDAVQLGDGPFRDRMERNRAYLLSLEPDRFLHYFRLTAGLAPKAEPYGGWESKVGRMLGHYLSACSMMTRASGETAFADRQRYVVDELAACQRANGNGYVGGVPEARRLFAEIAQGRIVIDTVGLNGVHAPWYMLHKMSAGLRDSYSYAGNRQALAVLIAFSDWADTLTARLSDGDAQHMLDEEHGGMNEVFADVYAFTGQARYLTLSRRFNHRSVLEPLTRGDDELDGLHANTQIPTVLGLYRQYEVSGDRAARRGGEFFWQTVTGSRTYVTGGNSDHERFTPPRAMSATLSAATAETCNSYNMVKLTDRLFAGQPREALAAYQERVLWNSILASQDTASPGMTYYLSLKPGHFKTFSTPDRSFWCCVGTGMENHAKYGESLYFQSHDELHSPSGLHSPSELWINQFVASTVDWCATGIRLVQTTAFPREPESRWTVHCTRATRAIIQLRHPRWAGSGFRVTVNGHAAGESAPGTYLRLDRTWHTGDTIVAHLPLRLALEPMPADPAWNALLYGPIVLAGLLGREGLPAEGPFAAGDQLAYRTVPDPPVPALATGNARIESWLKQTGPLEFVTAGLAPISFIPLFAVTRDRYSVYWKLS